MDNPQEQARKKNKLSRPATESRSSELSARLQRQLELERNER
jgi:hypothetical protein